MAEKEKLTANQIVDSVYVRTHTVRAGDDLSSTDGMRGALQANAQAIRALADYVDGIVTDPNTGARVDKSGKPVE